MYLTKLVLNPRNRGARSDVAQPYELHRTLLRSLDHTDTDDRLLFRLEPERGPGGPMVLVQSVDTEPRWDWMQANDYALAVHGPKPFDLTLEPGAVLAFRLTANPTVKKAREGKKHSARVPLIHDGPNDQGYPTFYDWLNRKADQHGFTVLRVQGAPFWTASPRKDRETYKKAEIPHFGVRFDGVLRVTDPGRLSEAVRTGIGPAKAFGFGLLSLAPTR